jgi:crotonobetainyl-CoA:carnitine CoA-transferase CaiB-like acyl-CoA transferase
MILVKNTKAGTWYLTNDEFVRATYDTEKREELLASHNMPANSGHIDVTKLRRRVEDRLRKTDLATLVEVARKTGVAITPEP